MNSYKLLFGNGRIYIVSILLILVAVFASPNYAETKTHAAAYEDALAKVGSGQAKLITEMERINSGQVAHFDFLQFEHLEILRFASALHYPPASLNEGQRIAIQEQADQLLVSAEALEWNIADFLRSRALLSSALSNILDIVSLAQLEAQSTSAASFQELTKAAGLFQNVQDASSLQRLSAALDKTIADLESASYRRELTAQKKLIVDNAAGPQHALAQVKAGALTFEAGLIAELYVQANGSHADGTE